MSYLDFPRLHFSGLFYTGPSTTNNVTLNYTPSVPLEDSTQQYLRNAGWNPNGVAQWWLEECAVLSAVGPGGEPAAAGDPVIGAAVWSPAPKTPMPDGQGGYYDIAKMVDLDPDQQGRSALYGVRLAVTLPGGAGLQGLMTVPELRQLNGRIPVDGGSWTAVGNWMGTLQGVVWDGDISGSPLLTALKAAAAEGLAVKLTVDLHQNNPANIFTAGDLFCYGRVLGSIGPALPGELAQVVPGRCVQTYTPPPAPPAPAASPAAATVESAFDAAAAEFAAAESESAESAAADSATGESVETLLQPRERVAALMAALAGTRKAAAANAEPANAEPANAESAAADAAPIDAAPAALAADAPAPAPPQPWNPAFAVVREAGAQTLLSLDIGGSILLNVQQTASGSPTSDGTFEVDSGITVGVFNLTTGQFVPFADGDIDIAPQYQQLASASKNCVLVKNSCVFTIPLTTADGDAYRTNPLAIQVGGATVAQEYDDGLWMDVSVSSERLECGSGQTAPARLMVRQFGNPVANQTPPVTSAVQLYQWTLQGGKWKKQLVNSNDLALAVGETDADGLADLSTSVNVQNIAVPPIRQPLDSQVYYISLNDPGGNTIGDGYTTLSVLLWRAFQAPAEPTWADVGAIFDAYARLYPGMKARLDISDEQTVVGFAPVVLGHMSAPFGDPSYMPVTRDLSPGKMEMIVSWLTKITRQPPPAGS